MRGKHVIVVDDVFTTGATLRSVAVALRPAEPKTLAPLCWPWPTRGKCTFTPPPAIPGEGESEGNHHGNHLVASGMSVGPVIGRRAPLS